MRKSLLCIAVASILAGCSPAPENTANNANQTAAVEQITSQQSAKPATERLNQWFEQKY